MTTRKEADHIHKIVFECGNCGRKREVEVHEGMAIEVGTVVQPYAGGGNWGRCLFCKAGGLKAVTAPEIKKKGPVGWRSKK